MARTSRGESVPYRAVDQRLTWSFRNLPVTSTDRYLLAGSFLTIRSRKVTSDEVHFWEIPPSAR
jgi:hypothetical protein